MAFSPQIPYGGGAFIAAKRETVAADNSLGAVFS
jgi:hypothetical protein